MSKISIKDISRALIFMIVFVLIFIFLSRVFAVTSSSSEDGMESRITTAYRGEARNSLDVIFTGNSDVYRGISPVDLYDKTGITSAVSGRPNNSPEMIVTDVKDILRYQTPEVIVLETDCLFSGKNPSFTKKRTDAPPASPVAKLRSVIKEADSAIISGINFYFPLIKYHDRWKKLKLSNFISQPSRFYAFSNKGMAYSDKVKPYTGDPNYMESSSGAAKTLSAENAAAFKKIYETCRQKNIRLVLITVPSANTWNLSKSNAVQKLADEYGLTYYDYNRTCPAGFDWSQDSKDGGNHLNYSGALKVTSDFGDKLQNDLGMQASKLTPKLQQKWEKDFEHFHTRIAKPADKSTGK